MKNEDKTILDVNVHVTGIKVRCRKIDRHMFKVGDFELDHDQEDLVSKALKIVGGKMKVVTGQVRLGITKTKVKDEGGFSSRSFIMFQDNSYVDITDKFLGAA